MTLNCGENKQLFLQSIAETLISPDIRFSAHVPLQVQLLAVVMSLIQVAGESCGEISYPLFKVLASVMALSSDETRTKVVSTCSLQLLPGIHIWVCGVGLILILTNHPLVCVLCITLPTTRLHSHNFWPFL